MNKKYLRFRILLAFLFFGCVFSQSPRISTHHQIGWYNYFGTFQLSKNLSLHTEYQWRRNDWITEWQQSLLRIGLNFHLHPRLLVRLGYGWIETFDYGEIPLNAFGKNFTEHRIFEAVQYTSKEGVVDLLQRLMLEQRFIGQYSTPQLESEDSYPLSHRIRYMLRLQVPINFRSENPSSTYLASYDEVFIGFGEHVNANVFDQNRFALLIGHQFNKHLRIEAGYYSQILQYGRKINQQNAFQYNNGIIVNAYITAHL